MALIDLDDIDDSYNVRVRDSLNTNTTNTNTANLTANLENVGNSDTSTTGSHNADIGVADSFNSDSHDTDLDVDVDIDDSFNDESDNSTDDHSDNSSDDHSDNSTNGSFNDSSDRSTNGSYNDNSQRWTDDHSVHVGNREFTLGSPMAGAAAGGGDSVFIDQSVNANVGRWGDFEQESRNDAVVASGDGSMAAGGDIRIDQARDSSMNISGGGDVNVGNTVDMTTVAFSYNTATDSSTSTSTDIDVNISDSWNDNSQSYTADGSFTAELENVSQSDWDIDANVIWGSEGAIVVDDLGVDDAPDM